MGMKRSVEDTQCSVPLDNVKIPEGYTHYPINDDDMRELLDDLKSHLTGTQAVDALGYAAAATWANCGNYWTITGRDHRDWLESWGEQNLPDTESLTAYLKGIGAADQEFRYE